MHTHLPSGEVQVERTLAGDARLVLKLPNDEALTLDLTPTQARSLARLLHLAIGEPLARG